MNDLQFTGDDFFSAKDVCSIVLEMPSSALGSKRVGLWARTLLPDVLSYDPTRPASFPSNGRTLTDDAGDAFLAILTNGKVTGDKIGPHVDLLAEFPYLGPPHNA